MVRRGCTVVLLAGVLLGAGSASAFAGDSLPAGLRTVAAAQHPLAVNAPIPLRVQRVIARRLGITAGSTTTSAESLVTNPVWVTDRGISYQMTVYAVRVPGFGQDVDVSLVRTAATASGVASQEHDYDYSGKGFHPFSVNTTTLRSAKIDFGSAAAPSMFTSRFQATQPSIRTPCNLFGGGTGTLTRANGSLSTSAFAIATGTTPFFGTITTPPLTGTLYSDPGCRGPALNFCPGTVTLGAFMPTSSWVIGNDPTGANAFEEVFTGSNAPTLPFPSHDVFSPVPSSDMVGPTITTNTVKMRWLTAQNPWMVGSATFTAATSSGGGIRGFCRAGGTVHKFKGTFYDGTLAGNSKPLIAIFDTGLRALHTGHAELDLIHYTS